MRRRCRATVCSTSSSTEVSQQALGSWWGFRVVESLLWVFWLWITLLWAGGIGSDDVQKCLPASSILGFRVLNLLFV